MTKCKPRYKGLVIKYGEGGGGGIQNGKFAGKTFKEWKLFAPRLQYGLNFNLQRKNYPKTFCAPLQHG